MSNQPQRDLALLSRPELLAALRDLLAELFADSGLTRIVVQDAGIAIGHIAFESAPLVRWDNILTEAGKQGKRQALVEEASATYPPHAEQLQQLAAAIDTREREATQSKATNAPPRPTNRHSTELQTRTTFDYDVFLSHSSKDKPTVRALAERLRADGLRVWLDEWVIEPGDMIGLKIEEGLTQSRTLILCMSQHAFASDWVTMERHTVLFRDPANSQRRFVPLRLDDCTIPDMIAQFAYVDWRTPNDESYSKLRRVCRSASSNADAAQAQIANTVLGPVKGADPVLVAGEASSP
ncbi:MAG TPA: toll/interleukin-1 receptor domain-containing protein, partial [Caldilineaceae bacterium]|nr:toll/interleukin-1 receptor domain-containing protein [Caldilineaceae bacterium]